MVLGLAPGKLFLARAHDDWAGAYERERARIVAALGENLLDIQHVGSTSIPDAPAKPILDILIGVRDFDEAIVCVGPMIALGYIYRGENGIARRHYFVKGDPRTHHVHMVEIQSDTWRDILRFRDLLRLNPALASEYAREKDPLRRKKFTLTVQGDVTVEDGTQRIKANSVTVLFNNGVPEVVTN
jgi:GrpB-like predicted nucleotidyltransferase (UPF0157 family)